MHTRVSTTAFSLLALVACTQKAAPLAAEETRPDSSIDAVVDHNGLSLRLSNGATAVVDTHDGTTFVVGRDDELVWYAHCLEPNTCCEPSEFR